MDAFEGITAQEEPFPPGFGTDAAIIVTVRPRPEEAEFNLTVRPGLSLDERTAAEEWGRAEMRSLVAADYAGTEAEKWNLFVRDGMPVRQRIRTLRHR